MEGQAGAMRVTPTGAHLRFKGWGRQKGEERHGSLHGIGHAEAKCLSVRDEVKDLNFGGKGWAERSKTFCYLGHFVFTSAGRSLFISLKGIKPNFIKMGIFLWFHAHPNYIHSDILNISLL